ncbi:MAG: elongation factor G [Myxococcota bacterium]|nr:elongation factor G [Myxococcota bacterium]
MQEVEVTKTRSFALIGHMADGKTTLGEALLHAAGATDATGSVDSGTSVLDFSPEERDRHHTLSSSVFSFDWEGHRLTLVDTPGDSNFQADGWIALPAVDAAVLVISASDGAKVGSERMLGKAQELDLAAVAVINGLDQDRADFAAALESLRTAGASVVEASIPIGSGSDLSGCVDLISMQAFVGGNAQPIPDDMAAEATAARARLVEAVAETDDELLERYLEEGELDDESVARGLVTAVRTRQLVPVFATSALQGIGIQPLLSALTELLPSPLERAPFALASGDGEIAADAEAPFSALVFKTSIDRYSGTLSFLRIVSGRLDHDTPILNATRDTRTRLGKLLVVRGESHEEVPSAGPGDIVAVAKVKDAHTGDALTSEKGGIVLAPIPIPEGVLSYAIEAHSSKDEDKVFTALGRLVEEDPTLHLSRDPATGEFLLTGMGELHMRITVRKLSRLYNAEVDLKTPKVPYRETITGTAANVEGKLKKQTGGKGMFGVCFLTVEPLPRGGGVEFVDEIVGGAIPRNLIPAVEKGVLESAEAGPLAGYPVVDVRVRCIDGKHHSVDSNEMAFKLAGSFGFKAGVEQARPTLLEPIMKAEITVPDDHVGDVMGDVSSRRGRVQNTEARGANQVIKAEVPMAEMLEYASALTSLTGGTGAFHMEFSHYDEVPAYERDKIVAEARRERAAES